MFKIHFWKYTLNLYPNVCNLEIPVYLLLDSYSHTLAINNPKSSCSFNTYCFKTKAIYRLIDLVSI